MSQLFDQLDFLGALWMTVKLTVLSAVLALILGTVVAILRLSPVPVLRAIGTAYVTVLRNTPLTLILLFCIFGLWTTLSITLSPQLSVNSFRYAIVGLSVYHAAFVCEAIRSGVNTIPLGQAEAARSIGLTFGQSLREVVLPQAFRGAITPLANTLIALTKNTTVAVTIGVVELAYFLNRVNEDAADQLNQAFLLVAVAFIVLTIPVGLLSGRLSQRLAVKR